MKPKKSLRKIFFKKGTGEYSDTNLIDSDFQMDELAESMNSQISDLTEEEFSIPEDIQEEEVREKEDQKEDQKQRHSNSKKANKTAERSKPDPEAVLKISEMAEDKRSDRNGSHLKVENRQGNKLKNTNLKFRFLFLCLFQGGNRFDCILYRL